MVKGTQSNQYSWETQEALLDLLISAVYSSLESQPNVDSFRGAVFDWEETRVEGIVFNQRGFPLLLYLTDSPPISIPTQRIVLPPAFPNFVPEFSFLICTCVYESGVGDT